MQKQQAQKVLNLLNKMYGDYYSDYEPDRPQLVKNWQHFGYYDGQSIPGSVVPYAIIWESGPDNWIDNLWVKVEQAQIGMEVSPYTSYAAAIYEVK